MQRVQGIIAVVLTGAILGCGDNTAQRAASEQPDRAAAPQHPRRYLEPSVSEEVFSAGVDQARAVAEREWRRLRRASLRDHEQGQRRARVEMSELRREDGSPLPIEEWPGWRTNLSGFKHIGRALWQPPAAGEPYDVDGPAPAYPKFGLLNPIAERVSRQLGPDAAPMLLRHFLLEREPYGRQLAALVLAKLSSSPQVRTQLAALTHNPPQGLQDSWLSVLQMAFLYAPREAARLYYEGLVRENSWAWPLMIFGTTDSVEVVRNAEQRATIRGRRSLQRMREYIQREVALPDEQRTRRQLLALMIARAEAEVDHGIHYGGLYGQMQAILSQFDAIEPGPAPRDLLQHWLESGCWAAVALAGRQGATDVVDDLRGRSQFFGFSSAYRRACLAALAAAGDAKAHEAPEDPAPAGDAETAPSSNSATSQRWLDWLPRRPYPAATSVPAAADSIAKVRREARLARLRYRNRLVQYVAGPSGRHTGGMPESQVLDALPNKWIFFQPLRPILERVLGDLPPGGLDRLVIKALRGRDALQRQLAILGLARAGESLVARRALLVLLLEGEDNAVAWVCAAAAHMPLPVLRQWLIECLATDRADEILDTPLIDVIVAASDEQVLARLRALQKAEAKGGGSIGWASGKRPSWEGLADAAAAHLDVLREIGRQGTAKQSLMLLRLSRDLGGYEVMSGEHPERLPAELAFLADTQLPEKGPEIPPALLEFWATQRQDPFAAYLLNPVEPWKPVEELDLPEMPSIGQLVAGLAEVEDPLYSGPLRGFPDGKTWQLAAAGTYALPAVLNALEHPQRRRGALAVLQQSGLRSPVIYDAVAALLQEPDPELQVIALHTLSRLGPLPAPVQ
ncbi:MAG: hypothetical protein ACOC93_02100 [Planctomycetota bacterium]